MSASPKPDAVTPAPVPETTRLLIEYDGTGFAGWARQQGQRTVQGELEQALAVVLRRPEVRLTVAGRTDTGVHAWGQVASYDGPPVRVGSVNALVQDDVAVIGAQATAPGFDARRDAVSRTYCYRLFTRPARSAFERRRALHWPHHLDRDALDSCAQALVGVHDFTAFTPTETEHVRFERIVHRTQWRVASDDALEFWIEADSFLRHMNRVLVGTMLQVAAGRRPLNSFEELLTGRPRAQAGPTAPPHGLFLAAVRYRP